MGIFENMDTAESEVKEPGSHSLVRIICPNIDIHKYYGRNSINKNIND